MMILFQPSLDEHIISDPFKTARTKKGQISYEKGLFFATHSITGTSREMAVMPVASG